jgi:cobaltochelatase CobT
MGNMIDGFLRQLQLFAQMLGQRYGVEVVIDSSVATAATDGKKIFIPNWGFSSSQETLDIVSGLVVHEAMHCKHTNFSVNTGQHGEFVRYLANVLEDVWGEKAQSRSHPGAPGMILVALKAMIGMGKFGGPQKAVKIEPSQAIGAWLLFRLRAEYLEQACLSQQAKDWESLARKMLGKKLIRKIWSIALQVQSCDSTARALEIALEIKSALKDASEEKDEADDSQPEPTDENKESNSGSDSGKSSSASGTGKDGAVEEEAGDSSDLDKPSAKERAKNAKKAINVAPGSTKSLDLGEIMGEFVQQIQAQSRGGFAINNGPISSGFKKNVTDELRGMARRVAVKLGSRIETLIEARTDENSFLASSGRKINIRAALKCKTTGNYRIFSRREEEDGISTAISIVVDYSYSMNDPLTANASRIGVAKAACMGLGDVLEKHHIPFCVYGFSEHLTALKGFDEAWKKKREFTERLGDYTNTELGVLAAARDLFVRDETRKMMVIITDGAPGDENQTLASMLEARRMGIEIAVVTIGYGGSMMELAMQHGFTHAKAENGDQLENAVFEAIKSAI